MSLAYRKTWTITGSLVVKTGLHIGAGRESVEIGGVDSPVIKHPHTQEPYIPGSSIKGKLRNLLEWALGKVPDNGQVWGSDRNGTPDPGDEILRTFGTANDKWNGGPTRLIVRDAHLERVWAEKTIRDGLPWTEDKTEVAIDRIQGKAASMGPRTKERVPAGARFELEILFKEFDDGDGGARDRECLNRVIEALKLLEGDCLGGSGSRGYGKVRIENLKVDGKDLQAAFDGIQPLSREQAQVLVS